MRLDYELFNQQLGILWEEEYEVFQQFIRGEKDLQAIAEDKGIVYESAQQRIHRVTLLTEHSFRKFYLERLF